MFFKLVSITQFGVIPPTCPFWRDGSHLHIQPVAGIEPRTHCIVTNHWTTRSPVQDKQSIEYFLIAVHTWIALLLMYLFLREELNPSSGNYHLKTITVWDGLVYVMWSSKMSRNSQILILRRLESTTLHMDAPDNYKTTYDSKTKIVVFYSLSNAFWRSI